VHQRDAADNLRDLVALQRADEIPAHAGDDAGLPNELLNGVLPKNLNARGDGLTDEILRDRFRGGEQSDGAGDTPAPRLARGDAIADLSDTRCQSVLERRAHGSIIATSPWRPSAPARCE